jgi:hypothetical protein
MAPNDLDGVVLSVLRQSPSSPDEIVDKVRAAVGLEPSETAILESMWRLIDRQQAMLTTDRKVARAMEAA